MITNVLFPDKILSTTPSWSPLNLPNPKYFFSAECKSLFAINMNDTEIYLIVKKS
ncbi:MAG: hypothetical protein TRG1_3435 [Flavobacteriaceae bacterium FS1-H7996/R]|nr:MAG: hypothetical protein TRG1_3435 [Flavobacteriaceae bacterium FS1-H7996/R]